MKFFRFTKIWTVAAAWIAILFGAALRAEDPTCPPGNASPGAVCSPDLLACAVAVEEREMRQALQAAFSEGGWIEHEPAQRYVDALNTLRNCQKQKGQALAQCWPKQEFVLTADFGDQGSILRHVPLVETAGRCQYGVPTAIPANEIRDCDEDFQDKRARQRGKELARRAEYLFQRDQLPGEGDLAPYLAAVDSRNACRRKHDPSTRPDCTYGAGLELSGEARPGLVQAIDMPIAEKPAHAFSRLIRMLRVRAFRFGTKNLIFNSGRSMEKHRDVAQW